MLFVLQLLASQSWLYRQLAKWSAAALIAHGYADASVETALYGVLLMLVENGVSKLADMQRRKTTPGAVFNPQAEVRTALRNAE
ncbi:MAG: hypothetical protein M3O82_04580 [Verrucomicrobiota bacterium]|nr:hypothetical protein [Verrucomicrobiota bacterium]